ncbi:Imidazole glycerol phosphate synthase subunit HisH [Sporomusa silvacetica DSM 10669]|uniref:Imidazole glycerol phosphate synthase subunit HisH n=1 Tax=Sporomusa silvacetica DSM 10669 TaxID=1123289 RepID=A0ABZ3IQV1_9FIRM|nr:imidazole glycerol phosphate synthase subunit HisH [Sporomusa silvacetica]OZC20543.1 imidazole glycerol phosphate synthase subunit HisH 1 [Sporomusa silvacetica DSM 10669]
MNKVIVVDYGLSNLLSICRALEYCGAEVYITDSPADVMAAERLVLPGVGAFADGMEGLRRKGLVNAIREFAAKERPFLGICLGMQMMLDSSEEFGINEGLGLIPGIVQAIPPTDIEGNSHKIPHIGWNLLQIPSKRNGWKDSILSSIDAGCSVYFVHSYTAVPHNDEARLADTFYNGRLISAAIKSGNLYGCQFHPEKSGTLGLKIIKNWLDI